LERLLPSLRRHGVRAVSANGVLGDPTGASALDGARLLGAMARAVAAEVIAGEADATPPMPGYVEAGAGMVR
jgi:creatinine amidohydrolase